MENQNNDLQIFQKVDELRNDALQKSFNGISINGCGQSGPDFYAYIPESNDKFINSDYYYKGDLHFFHLTSIANLWSILNSRSFRLYNLHSSKDENEYKNAAHVLGLADEIINYRKQFIYTLSFCSVSSLETKEVWEKYGNNFKGAAIVFEIINDPLKWQNFHMAEVKYDQLDGFVNYKKQLEEIKSQFYWVNERTDLSKLICFHKTSKWQGENEVRIATYFPYKRTEEYWKYSKTEFRLEGGRNRITNYIELPIWVDNESHLIKSYATPELDRIQNLPQDYFVSRPQIKLKQILIGVESGISPQEFDKYRLALLDTVRFNLGYEVDIPYDFVKF
ncbi:MAG: DUF2971 domain-containing protein [Sphingobacteriales bacterium]|nr:DUF2971 domain-containing protein [Sphingobacteriales bacterium]